MGDRPGTKADDYANREACTKPVIPTIAFRFKVAEDKLGQCLSLLVHSNVRRVGLPVAEQKVLLMHFLQPTPLLEITEALGYRLSRHASPLLRLVRPAARVHQAD